MPDTAEKQRRSMAGWNGIRLTVPPDWEFRVIDKQHIVFERKFEPLLQLKWEMHSRKSDIEKIRQPAEEKMLQFAEDNGAWLGEVQKRYEVIPVAEDSKDNFAGVLYCEHCTASIHFQLLSATHKDRRECGQILATLNCHDNNGAYAWTLQDTTFFLPAEMELQQYGFKAGLSWTSHKVGATTIKSFRLAPADRRLAQATATSILKELTGEDELRQDHSCPEHDVVLFRAPSISRQLVYRMRRRSPFLQAALRHLAATNVLAGCIISSKQPLSPAAATELLPVAR